MLVPEEVRKCVAFLCYKAENTVKLAGTAFFVSIPVKSRQGKSFIYVVTAKHI